MEKIIAGTKVKDSKEIHGKTSYCEFSMIVKKGHEECGDSLSVYSDSKKTIIAVFDGVSGEPGAAKASSEAAGAVIRFLKDFDKADEKTMKKAVQHAQDKVVSGFTTALISVLESNGTILLAGVGDSAAYAMEKNRIDLELPLGRAVKKGDSILKFLYFRNLVTSVIGPSGSDISINIRKGKLGKGSLLMLASDGLVDNLRLIVKEGYVTDGSGTKDLEKLIGKQRDPKKILKLLVSEVKSRIRKGKKQSEKSILAPKTDDITIAVLRRI